MPVANGTLLHKKKGTAIDLLFLHDYSPSSLKKRNSPAKEDDFTMLTSSLSRRHDALLQKSSPRVSPFSMWYMCSLLKLPRFSSRRSEGTRYNGAV